MKWSKNDYKQAENMKKILLWQLVRTERRAHVEIILSKTGEESSAKPGFFLQISTFPAVFNLAFLA